MSFRVVQSEEHSSAIITVPTSFRVVKSGKWVYSPTEMSLSKEHNCFINFILVKTEQLI